MGRRRDREQGAYSNESLRLVAGAPGPPAPTLGRGHRACSLLVTGASALGYLEFLQARTLDLLLHVQGQRFPSEVVIVAIDDAAFESLGRRQPLSRAYLAQLLQGLRRSGAAVVGLDVALTCPTTLADDATLAQAMRDFT